jgi:signal transduction histidine kinase
LHTLGDGFGSSVHVTLDGEPHDLTPSATIALLRVAQEALVNAAKHAPGQPVDMRLAYGPSEVTLEIGNMIEESVTVSHSELRTIDGGYGLTGMKERLLLIGGTLDAGQHDGRWTATAVAPYPSAGTED